MFLTWLAVCSNFKMYSRSKWNISFKDEKRKNIVFKDILTILLRGMR